MNQSITVSTKILEQIISRLDELIEDVREIKVKLFDEDSSAVIHEKG